MKYLLWFFGGVIVIGLLLFIVIGNSVNENGTIASNQQPATVIPNETATTKPAQSSAAPAVTYQFYETTIQNLVQLLDKNNGQSVPSSLVPNPLVEVSGKVLNKKLFQGTETNGSKAAPVYFIEVGDPNGYIAMLMLDPTKPGLSTLYSEISVGENVVIRGAFGSDTCESSNQSSIQWCSTFGISQINIPVLVGLQAMPEMGNENPIEPK